MRPLRIALIRQRYTAFGGAERFVARAATALAEQGVELALVTRRWADDRTARALICNPFYIGNLWRDWGFARCVCKMLAQENFDLVQSHERIACCDVYRAGDGVHREWLKQRRRVLRLRGKIGIALNPYHYYVTMAEKALFHSPRLKAVICNSRMVKEEIRHYFGVPEEKLHIIYSGVDTAAFHPTVREQHRDAIRARYGIPPDCPVFLFVGAGFERKGLAALLNAMAALPPSTHLLVVGKDRKIGAFRTLAAKLHLNRRVCFVGAQAEVRPFYGAADALVLPTLYDPFPNVALEAMACSLPVITSSKSGAAECIRPGENGFVCDALDTAGLADAMARTIKNSRAMGIAARKTVEPFDLDAMGSALHALYRSLVERRFG
ncbi:MAG TPA: glycosyl transferase family 1 [Betaproteobacteria bacterium]|nr:glycosyl transferase family 1 [Betaproteobacteria bacterium]